MLASCAVLITLLLVVLPRRSPHPSGASDKKARYNALFSLNSPLFPPSAVISLTDDNSTFFLSRPAAFGPLLPDDGLSGQLWIGSGFGDDILGRGGFAAGIEGELGCSDVPGWDMSTEMVTRATDAAFSRELMSANAIEGGEAKDRTDAAGHGNTDEKAVDKPNRDGTDDHLHPTTEGLPNDKATGLNRHADIESLQESAEIAGKVVLLSRGGCGFLEKVMWAQRRGGIAVIVGDDVVGGPLVTMYAKGDTSNVSIPALFTSHTTAHLLSSLVPAGASHIVGTPGYQTSPRISAPKSGVMVPKDETRYTPGSASEDDKTVGEEQPVANRGWVPSFLSFIDFGLSESPDVHRKPLNSGHHDWIALEECLDCPSKSKKPRQKQSTTPKSGGSLPGSGEYENTAPSSSSHDRPSSRTAIKTDSWLANLLGFGSNTRMNNDRTSHARRVTRNPSKSAKKMDEPNDPVVHDGLWVTITPTNMSSSPFLDTLLVLVVSPLITLTVVYALLLIRSRIRRRRWRAPKSVVDRLPIRTYHTMSSEASSSAVPTPATSSPTTPLLQSEPQQIPSRPQSLHRVRSFTTSEVPEQSASAPRASRVTPSSSAAERRESGLAEWRRRYGGRQRECAVCLEDYVDGVSRVMSLPCGHEFHADCMYVFPTFDLTKYAQR